MLRVQIIDWCFQAFSEQGNVIKCQLIHCCVSEYICVIVHDRDRERERECVCVFVCVCAKSKGENNHIKGF